MGSTNTTKEVIELTAIDNATRVIQGVSGAAQKLGATYDGLISKMGSLGLAVAGLGSVGAFGAMIKSTLEGEAALLRLSERTGNTVEALSSLSKVAKMSNADMDDVGKGMQKLAKSMAEAESGTGKAGKVFEALQISVRDASTGALKPTQVVMQELGQKLMNMKDQTLAVAFAQEVLGKSGANLLPFLYELARAGELQVKVTTEQARAAKEFEDNLVRLQSSSMDFWRHLANDMLPTLNNFLEQMVEGKKIAGSFSGALRNFGMIDPGMSVQENITKTQGELQDWQGASGLKKFFTKPFGATYAGTEKDLQNRLQFLKFQRGQEINDQYRGVQSTGEFGELGYGKTSVANPFGGGGGGTVKDTFGPALEAQQRLIAATQQQTEAEKMLWETQRGRYADLAPNQKQELIAGAQTLDLIKLWSDKAKEQIELTKKLDTEEARVWKMRTDNAALYAEAFEKMRKGELGEEENLATRVEVVAEKTKETNDFARQMGLTFTSAFEQSVIHGKKFSDVLKGIIQDLATIALRKTVTEPLGKAASDKIGSFDFKSLFSTGGSVSNTAYGSTSFADAFAVGTIAMANGGIVSQFGSMPLRTYSSGGIANSPQMAMFGEGSTPEAYVPLPDGRRIPVTMKGGGQVINVYPDLRGASVETVSALHRMVSSLNASIEPRVVSTMRSARQRGIS